MSYKQQVEKIQAILEEAKVPQRWYSINTPVDNKISIVAELDGIHLFILEHNARLGEEILTNWYETIKFSAEMVELQYTERIMCVAQKYRSVL